MIGCIPGLTIRKRESLVSLIVNRNHAQYAALPGSLRIWMAAALIIMENNLKLCTCRCWQQLGLAVNFFRRSMER
ncbi:hypothetical protein [Desulfotomaculum copahuensis]|uniref:hypothetical protein n=1 Tax=Desulfotomaculum copahuensis TaxID=1838280 RepID=UPI001249246E|nr:hypothetical protein [Desulfotomaculum copahuensis]